MPTFKQVIALLEEGRDREAAEALSAIDALDMHETVFAAAIRTDSYETAEVCIKLDANLDSALGKAPPIEHAVSEKMALWLIERGADFCNNPEATLSIYKMGWLGMLKKMRDWQETQTFRILIYKKGKEVLACQVYPHWTVGRWCTEMQFAAGTRVFRGGIALKDDYALVYASGGPVVEVF